MEAAHVQIVSVLIVTAMESVMQVVLAKSATVTIVTIAAVHNKRN